MGTVSVITATLNRPSLRFACESVDRQTFTDWHHYVIGDGVAPVDYVHPQRSTIGFTTHVGAAEPAADMPFGTPNAIFRWAFEHFRLGSYVCILDDDNIYKPQFLATMSGALSSSSAGIAICALEDLRESAIHDGYPELERCDMSGFLVRTDVARAVGFPPEYIDRDAISDYDFIKKCADCYGWLRIPERLVVYGYGERLYGIGDHP